MEIQTLWDSDVTEILAEWKFLHNRNSDITDIPTLWNSDAK